MAAGLRRGSGAITQFSHVVPYICAPAEPEPGCMRRGDITGRGSSFASTAQT